MRPSRRTTRKTASTKTLRTNKLRPFSSVSRHESYGSTTNTTICFCFHFFTGVMGKYIIHFFFENPPILRHFIPRIEWTQEASRSSFSTTRTGTSAFGKSSRWTVAFQPVSAGVFLSAQTFPPLYYGSSFFNGWVLGFYFGWERIDGWSTGGRKPDWFFRSSVVSEQMHWRRMVSKDISLRFFGTTFFRWRDDEQKAHCPHNKLFGFRFICDVMLMLDRCAKSR